MGADAVEVWTGPEGDDGTSDLDTGQARIPEVTHQMQGVQQVANKSRAPQQLQGALRSTSRSWTSSHR